MVGHATDFDEYTFLLADNSTNVFVQSISFSADCVPAKFRAVDDVK